MLLRWSAPLDLAALNMRGYVAPEGPVLDDTSWDDVLVTEARSDDGRSLRLALRPRDSAVFGVPLALRGDDARAPATDCWAPVRRCRWWPTNTAAATWSSRSSVRCRWCSSRYRRRRATDDHRLRSPVDSAGHVGLPTARASRASPIECRDCPHVSPTADGRRSRGCARTSRRTAPTVPVFGRRSPRAGAPQSLRRHARSVRSTPPVRPPRPSSRVRREPAARRMLRSAPVVASSVSAASSNVTRKFEAIDAAAWYAPRSTSAI